MNADRMSEAIALSSPSGRMSKRVHTAAMRRFQAMFDADRPVAMVASEGERLRKQAEQLRRSAHTLRSMASMHPRSYPRIAAEREAEALVIETRASQIDREQGR